jgi:hypothetical protein
MAARAEENSKTPLATGERREINRPERQCSALFKCPLQKKKKAGHPARDRPGLQLAKMREPVGFGKPQSTCLRGESPR